MINLSVTTAPARRNTSTHLQLRAVRRAVTIALLALFLCGSLAGYQAWRFARFEAVRAGSPDAVQTVREFYLDLEQFTRTGNADPLLHTVAEGAWNAAPGSGLHGKGSGFAAYLLALRSQCQNASFTVANLSTTGRTVNADVTANCAPTTLATSQLVGSSSAAQFEVAGGRISAHSSDPEAPALQYRASWLPGSLSLERRSRLTITRVSVLPDARNFTVLPGPAVVFVEHGAVAVTGNGLFGIVDNTDSRVTPSPAGQTMTIEAGATIFIPKGQLILQGSGQQEAELLFAGFVRIPRTSSSANLQERTDFDPNGVLSFNMAAQGEIGRPYQIPTGVVTPLSVSASDIGAGDMQFTLAWWVLQPGAATSELPVSATRVAATLSGTVMNVDTASQIAGIRNNGEEPALVLAVWSDPA